MTNALELEGRGGPRRMIWLVPAALAIAVVLVARLLTPSPLGLGTHTQLGLPRCGFFVLTGLPCPACGLTTSFAHMARGDFTAALHAHAIGALLFIAIVASVPLCVWACVRDLPPSATLARVRVHRISALLAGLVIAHWCVRMLSQLQF